MVLQGVDVGGCVLRLTVHANGVTAEQESPCSGDVEVVLRESGGGQTCRLPYAGPIRRYSLDIVPSLDALPGSI